MAKFRLYSLKLKHTWMVITLTRATVSFRNSLRHLNNKNLCDMNCTCVLRFDPQIMKQHLFVLIKTIFELLCRLSSLLWEEEERACVCVCVCVLGCGCSYVCVLWGLGVQIDNKIFLLSPMYSKQKNWIQEFRLILSLFFFT